MIYAGICLKTNFYEPLLIILWSSTYLELYESYEIISWYSCFPKELFGLFPMVPEDGPQIHIKFVFLCPPTTFLFSVMGYGLSIRVRLLGFLFTFYYLVVVWPYLNWPLADTEPLYLGNPMCLFQVFRWRLFPEASRGAGFC